MIADRRLPLISATGSCRMGRRVGEVVAGNHAANQPEVERFGRGEGAGGEEKFVSDFVAAWTKVMTLDRFDIS